MYVERHEVSITTAADGTAAGYTPVITGRIINVIYAKDGANPFTDGVDFDVTLDATGQEVWNEDNVNASKTVAPRQATHDTVGLASLYAAAGEPVEDYIYAANDRAKVSVASGGDTKVGTFTVIVG